MTDGPASTHTLGLEHEGAHVRGAELIYARKQIVCKKIFVLDGRGEEEDVKPLYMSEQGKELERAAKKSLVITGIEASKTIIRQMEVKLKKEKDIDAILAFQAEPLLPFPPEEAYIDKSILKVDDEGSLLTIFAVRNDAIGEHIEGWKRLGVEPEVVGSTAHALANFAALTLNSTDPLLMLHIGHLTTTLVLVQNGKVLASQAFKNGIHSLVEAYLKDTNSEAGEKSDVVLLSGLDLQNVDKDKYPLFANALLQYQRECVRSAYGLARYAHVGDVASIIATGEGAKHPVLSTLIAKAIGKPLLAVNVPSGMGITEQDAHYYAVPIGLALTGLPNHKEEVNFRQRDMAYPYPWKRLRNSIAAYVGLCAGLTAALYLFGQSYLGWQEDNIRENYVGLVSQLKRDYVNVEKKLGNTSTDASGQTIAPDPKTLTPEQINSRLDFFEKEIDAAPNNIALFPNVPRVSDVLTWLSHHPQVALPGKKEGTKDAQIHIDSFNYRMTKRPELTKPRDKYSVQVDIDFTSDSPRAARLFYDSLIAPNDFIDPRGEVKWTASTGRYRVSFFLKDKTVYPNP